MDNIRAAMIMDRGMSPLEEEVRQKAARTVIRMCADHEIILNMLGLDPAPGTPQKEPEVEKKIETCKRGHPKIRENQRKGSRGNYRCKVCDKYSDALRREKRLLEEQKKGPVRSPRSKSRSTESDILRNIAISNAKDALGLTWRNYRDMYGCKASTALAVVEAAERDDLEALEALKKENR